MKNYLKIFSLLFILLGAFSSSAYPWMFFGEKNSSDIFKLDTHASYFGKKLTVFSGFDLSYDNDLAAINLGYNYSFLEKNHYPRLSELSVRFPFLWEDWSFFLGFKDIVWNNSDRYWNHGFWQSRYLLDPFRPEQMGLPGLYLQHERENSSVNIFLSYFYLPDIVIYPELINQRVSSLNPLFIDKTDEKIKEILPTFQLKKFIKPNFAVQFKNSVEESFYINFSYAYKGMNQLQKAFLLRGDDLSSLDSTFQIEKIDYFSNSHHLISLETELVIDKLVSFFASFTYDRPENRVLPKDWWSTKFPHHYTVSLLAYFREKSIENTLFTLGWTKTTDLSQSDENLVLADFREIFTRNLDWKSALSASVEHENKNLYDGVLFRMRGNYALDNHFYHLILENYFYFSKYFRFYISGDILLRFSDRSLSLKSSSIKKYKGLNRILIGGQYVF